MKGKGKAIFAAGCFWGVEHFFSEVKGVTSTRVGYTGGTKPNPTYQEVCTDLTGHAEAVLLEHDPSKIGYEELVWLFFSIHDPTTLNYQGPDHGTQYRSAIFYLDEDQRKAAEKVIGELGRSGRFEGPIVTEVTRASTFYDAEEYHQGYFKKHGLVGCHVV